MKLIASFVNYIHVGIVIVTISILIIYFNIGLQSELKEFLFFIQVCIYI